MGWTSCNSWKTKDDVITEILSDGQFIDKTLRGNELWTIMQAPTGEQVIVLFLLSKERGSYAYKVMDEGMGPYYYKCPVSFLDRVPVASYEWREKVRAYARQQQVKRFDRTQAKRDLGLKKTPYGWE